MKEDLILIVGASGTVGSELKKLLKEQGYPVRATTSKEVKNPEQVYLNLITGEGIKDAFEGADRAFFLSPPGYADQYATLAPLIQEAKRRGLKKVVMMTAMGADAHEASPFRRAEVMLEKSGLNYNIIRPNWFLQNFHTYWAQGIAEQNKILLPAGNAKVSFIDARDIAAVAAQLLVSDKLNNQAFDLTGGEALDHTEVAQAISQVSAREITYQEISPQQFLESLLKAGLPNDYAELLGVIMDALKEGYSARTTTSVQEITGFAPTTLAQYVNDYKTNFIRQ